MDFIRRQLVPAKISYKCLANLSKCSLLKNYLLICVSMCFFLTSINGINSIASTINKEKGLGSASQALYYGSYGLFAFMIPQLLINFISFKWSLITGYALQLFFVSLKAYVNWPVYMLSSFIGGFGSALVWTCSSLGVNQLCKLYIDVTKANAQATQTLFFGIFGAFLQFSSVLGNLLSATILQSKRTPMLNQTSFDYSVCGKSFCHDTKLPSSSYVNLVKVYALIGAFSIFTCLSVLIGVLMDNLAFVDENLFTFKDFVRFKLKEYRQQVYQIDQLLVLPLNVLCPFLSTFIWADFSRGFAACSAGIEYIGYSMMCLSGISAIFSPIFGKIASKFSIQFVLYFYYMLAIATYLFMLLYWKSSTQTLYMLFVLVIPLGIIESINLPQPRALYGILFKNDVAYSIFNIIQGLGFLMSYILSTFLCIYIKIYVILCICGLCTVCDVIRSYRHSKFRLKMYTGDKMDHQETIRI